MAKTVLVAVSFLLFIGMPCTAIQARPVSSTDISEAMAYVAENAFPKPRRAVGMGFKPPTVKQQDAQFIAYVQAMSPHGNYSVKSFYIPAQKTIWLKENFSTEDMPLLVHEMRNYYGDFYGLPSDCEFEAYTLQDAYAREHENDRWRVADYRIRQLARCEPVSIER